ncbi:hypothetical protein AKG08_19080 [Achromobacter piechaudii]|nr:hypothetical protein AKG08_19080 [Achromobacter piechaudii]
MHGLGRQSATDHAPVLGPRDQAGILQHPQMFQESGQRHRVRAGQFADRRGALFQVGQHPASGAVRQGGKNSVQRSVV